MWIAQIIRMSGICLLISIVMLIGAIQLGKARTNVTLLAYISSPLRYSDAELRLLDVWHGADVLLAQINHFETPPIWSPDGRYMLFVVEHLRNPARSMIGLTYIIQLDTHTHLMRALTNNRRTISEAMPTWSITGNIAYARYDGMWDVVIMRPNLPRTQLLNHTMPIQNRSNVNEHTPKWSPDGTQLAYLVGGQYYAELWLMDEYGNNARPLTENMQVFLRQYDWSPRGTHIVLTTERDGNREIYSVNVTNGAFINLSRNQHHDFSPKWSPDGSQIAFISDRTTPAQAFLMGTDGGNLRQVTDGTHRISDIYWSPDGAWLIYVATKVNQHYRSIFMVSAEGDIARQLTFGQSDDFLPQWKP